MSIDEILVKDDKTIKAILDEQGLSSPILLEVNGKVFYPEEVYDKILKRGAIVVIIPLIAGG
jgi:sulfur carrier protein ThiS